MSNLNLPYLASIVGNQAMESVQTSMAYASPAMSSFLSATPEDFEAQAKKELKDPVYPKDMPLTLLEGYNRNDDLSDHYDDLSVSWWEDQNKTKLGGYDDEGVWHGASRIPSAPNEGLLLKLVGDDMDSSYESYVLGLLGELHYTDRKGNYKPNVLYRKNEGFFKDRMYSFSTDQYVDPAEFTRVPDSEIREYLDMPYNYPKVAEYILPNEVVHSKWTRGDRPGFQGDKYYAYSDSGPDAYTTIGIGHLVDPRKPHSIKYTQQQLDSIGAGHIRAIDLANGEIGLSESQMMQLFISDIKDKTRVAEQEFPDMYSYPDYVQAAIIDGYFWGMLPKSPKTRSLIKNGKYREAGAEYLDNKTYRNNLNRPRFHRFQEAMNRWADELEGGGE